MDCFIRLFISISKHFIKFVCILKSLKMFSLHGRTPGRCSSKILQRRGVRSLVSAERRYISMEVTAVLMIIDSDSDKAQ